MKSNSTLVTGTHSKKLPLYKRLWFWIPIVFIVIIFAALLTYRFKNTMVNKFVSAENLGKTTTLNSGMYIVGVDIQPGRYLVRVAKGSSRITDDFARTNITVGPQANATIGQVSSYTTELVKGDKFAIDGLKSASFTALKNVHFSIKKLPAGSWLVGKDIKPGRYIITGMSGFGNLSTNDGEINENIGKKEANGTSKITKVQVSLKEGQILQSSLPEIKLTTE